MQSIEFLSIIKR